MKNILNYIKENSRTFEEYPFNEVDSLILSQLSYLNLSNVVPSVNEDGKSVTLRGVADNPHYDEMFNIFWMTDKEAKLLSLASQSPRFSDIELNYYEDVLEESPDAQFSAVTFLLPDESVYIAFRGTDATLLGWKEDMKLAYSKPLESQRLASEYLNHVAKKTTCPIRVGGHSKGGNLATYGAMMCDGDVRMRILDIFNHDGPGFRPEILSSGYYHVIEDRIHKYIPKSSIVGIIFEGDKYDIVESYGVGALQHNAFSWKIEDGAFKRTVKKSFSKIATNDTINEWIFSLSEEEIDIFVNSLYDMLSARDAKSLEDLKKNPIKSFAAASGKYKELSEDNQKILEEILDRLKSIYGENLLEGIVVSTREFTDKFINKFSKKKG